MVIITIRSIYSCREKTCGSKTSRGLWNGLQWFYLCVQNIDTTSALNMDINKTRGNDMSFCIDYFLAIRLIINVSYLGNCTIFDENINIEEERRLSMWQLAVPKTIWRSLLKNTSIVMAVYHNMKEVCSLMDSRIYTKWYRCHDLRELLPNTSPTDHTWP